MSDRTAGVLRNIDDVLDGALEDWDVSGDAMRWTPPEDQELVSDEHAGEFRPGATRLDVTIPVTYDFIDHDAINDLIADLDRDDPRVAIRDSINRIQEDVWGSVLVSIQGSTIDSANGDLEDGQEVFIGFDVTGDAITWALVSGDCTWRTGSFPIPESADRDALADMDQVVVKGRWVAQPTDRGTP